MADPRFWLPLLAIALTALGLWKLARKNRRVGVLAVMAAVSFVPILNFVRVARPADMGDTMAARFWYMPSLPVLALAVVMVTGLKWARPAISGLLVTGLVAVGLTGTWRRNRDWSDELSMFSKTVQETPGAPLPWVRLGFAYLRHGELEDADSAIARAASLAPGSWLVRNARVNMLVRLSAPG